MSDLGAVGVTPDPAEWEAGDDYSHASKAFAAVLQPEAPYIDETALAAAFEDFDGFLRHSLANGFNAVAFPGFVEFVTFDGAPDGAVYPEGDDHRDKALALREAFAPFWERADELGVKVFLRTDMLALTGPLESYLDRPVRVARHREPRVLGRLRRRPRRAVRGRARARRRADPHRRGGARLRRRRLGLLLRARSDHGRRRADDARGVHDAGRGIRSGSHLPHLERGRRRRRRHAHERRVVRGRARRHRLARRSSCRRSTRSATSTRGCR